jgi:hypothetical protein
MGRHSDEADEIARMDRRVRAGRMAPVTEKTASLELIAAPAIEKRIFVVRGRQVMLDEDLADLYGVETKRLVE